MPGFVVLCPGKPVVGPALWSNSFLPGIYQGTHINNGQLDPKKIISHIRARPSVAPGLAVFDVALCDEKGEEVAVVEGFTMRQVSAATRLSSRPAGTERPSRAALPDSPLEESQSNARRGR